MESRPRRLWQSLLWWLPSCAVVIGATAALHLAQQNGPNILVGIVAVSVGALVPGALLVAAAATLSACAPAGRSWHIAAAWFVVWATSPLLNEAAATVLLGLQTEAATWGGSAGFDVTEYFTNLLVNTGPAAVLILLSVLFGRLGARKAPSAGEH